MSFSCPQASLDEILALAKRFGYEGIEPRTAAKHKHGVELEADADARRLIRKKVAESGVSLCCIATSCRYADPRTSEQNVAETLRYIDLAADTGAPKLRVFGGPLSEEISRKEAIALLSNSLRSVADHAARRKVTVCVETHDDWCDPAHLEKVMKRVDHPAIMVNWDSMHPVRRTGSTMNKAFQILRPWIRHVHFHDGLARMDKCVFKPLGEGDFDYRRVVELLKSAGYKDYLSGEWIDWEPYEVHLPRELAVMKRYEHALT